MKPNLGRLILTGLLLAAATLLFRHALGGGGPLFYFLSAVSFGMALASLQARGPGRDRQGGRGRGPGS